jgi:quinol monooxygenase YgiN
MHYTCDLSCDLIINYLYMLYVSCMSVAGTCWEFVLAMVLHGENRFLHVENYANEAHVDIRLATVKQMF